MKFALISLVTVCVVIAGCKSQNLEIEKPDGTKLMITFYKGSDAVPDLLIINETNYFGKVGYDDNDPLTDLSWKGEDGSKANAECVKKGPQKYDASKMECKLYRVFRSTNDLIPRDSTFLPPSRI